MLGIDVSKAELACTWLDPQDQSIRWSAVVGNSPAGMQQILEQTPADVAWVLEPTGALSQPVVETARAAGRAVLQAQPKRAQSFLRSVSARAKTDQLDSLGLAQYALAVALRPFPQKSEAVKQVEQLLAARKGIVQSLSRLRAQQRSLPYAAEALEGARQDLQARRDELDRQILAARTGSDELHDIVQRLKTVPGIGEVTANAVGTRLVTHDFGHSDKFVAYVGLDVQVRDSGQRQGRRALSHQGDAELRRLLFLAAMSNARARDPNNPFRRQYERELGKGLRSTQALCAVARKLARTCWSLHRHRSEYDPRRVNQQPHSGSC